MYHKIAKWMVEVMRRNNPALEDSDMREISAYGIEITLSTAVSYILIIAIGLLFRSPLSILIFALVFNIIRRYIGGYHCSTYLRCNLTFCTIFTLVLVLSKALSGIMSISIMILLLLVCGYGVWYWGPVENIYKPVTAEQQIRCHTIAKGIYFIDLFLAIGCYIWSPYYGLVAVFSLLAVVILLPLGTVAERRRRYEAEEKNRGSSDQLLRENCS